MAVLRTHQQEFEALLNESFGARAENELENALTHKARL